MREVETDYGCFKCGEVKPRIRTDNEGFVTCLSCGNSHGVISFKQSLDMINGFYLNNADEVAELMQADEYYVDYLKETDTEGC